MAFNVPESQYGKIETWIIGVIQNMPFVKGVAVYDSDFFISSSTNLPAIAVQRGELLEEDEPDRQCAGQNNVKSTVTVTLHVPPTEKDTLDPILYYFEENVYKEILDAYLTGNPPSHLNYLEFSRSKISNLFIRESNTVFSNISPVMFNIGYSV